MKTSRQSYPIPLSFVLALSLPLAAGQFTYTTNDGTITTRYAGPGGTVTIRDTINRRPVTTITNVAIPENVSTSGSIPVEGYTALAQSQYPKPSGKTFLPYHAEFAGQIIHVTLNPDGTRDHLEVNMGHGTFIGRATQLASYQVGVPVYDLASNALLIRLAGAFVITSANGDTLSGPFEGIETIPLDEQFLPLPPPYVFRVNWQASSGTGRFAKASGTGSSTGLDHGAGVISRTDTGALAF